MSCRCKHVVAVLALGLLAPLVGADDEADAVAALTKVGATVSRDKAKAGNPVVHVNLGYGKVTSADLAPDIRKLWNERPRVDGSSIGPTVNIRLDQTLSKAVDDLGSRRHHIAERLPADPLFEALDDLGWKAVREGGERLAQDNPHHLPVARHRVLAG